MVEHTGPPEGARRLTIPPPGALPLLAGLGDFPVLFRVHPRTGDTWRDRGVLPDPDLVVSGKCPVWLVDRLAVWAQITGRGIWPDDLIAWRVAGGVPEPRQRDQRVIRVPDDIWANARRTAAEVREPLAPFLAFALDQYAKAGGATAAKAAIARALRPPDPES